MTTDEKEAPSMSVAGQAALPDAQPADESAVVRVGGEPSGGAGTQELIGTGFAYRHDWGDWRGQVILRLNWDFVNANTRVFVSIAEGAGGGGKFIGNARYTVHNVAPRPGGVDIWVNIEWSSPIRLYVDYLAIN